MVRLIKKTTDNYTHVSNQIIRDSRLSWKARGIFAYMWSQADNWNFYVNELAKHSTDGEATLKSGLKELEQLGYLIRKHSQNKKGVFDGMEWVLTDRDPKKPTNKQKQPETPPQSDSHHQGGFPSDGKTIGWENHRMENRPLRNNNSKNYQQQELPTTRTHSASTSDAPSVSQLEDDFDKLWKRYPNKKGKKAAFNHYKAWRKKSAKHTDDYLNQKLDQYLLYCQQNSWYHPMNGSTWFNGRFDDELTIDTNSSQPGNGSFEQAAPGYPV